MKRLSIILIFALSLVNASVAQDYFTLGNQAYSDGDYATAIDNYQKALDSAGISAETYYNLGNAYYRSNELGLAILNYERALAVNPLYKDAKYNLGIAQERITDNVVDTNTFFLSKWINALIRTLKAHTWMWISIATFLLCLIGLFFYFFSKNIALRKTGFHTAWITLLLSIISLTFCLVENSQEKNRSEAVIMAGIINAKASPDRSGTDLFVLHEGTKVNITDSISDWIEIEVGNNKGWIPAKAAERI